MKTITAKFLNKAHAEQFYKDTAASQCYPWNLESLRVSVAHKPEYNQGWLIETWHYADEDAALIEHWVVWMTLAGHKIQVTDKISTNRGKI